MFSSSLELFTGTAPVKIVFVWCCLVNTSFVNVCVKCVEGDCKAALQAGRWPRGEFGSNAPQIFCPQIFSPPKYVFAPKYLNLATGMGARRSFWRGGIVSVSEGSQKDFSRRRPEVGNFIFISQKLESNHFLPKM